MHGLLPEIKIMNNFCTNRAVILKKNTFMFGKCKCFLSVDSFSSSLLVRLEDSDGEDGDDFFQKSRKERKN